MKKMNVIERTTPVKTSKKAKPAASPTVLMNGKRTAEQLVTESNFAKSLAAGAYDAIAAQIRQMKRAGKLVDCSI